MALTIKEIPTLKSQAARTFVSKAEASLAKKGSVDFSKQIASSKRILEKAKFWYFKLNYLEESCTFHSLNDYLLTNCNPFDCGHSDLNDFFQNDAINYSNELLGKTYFFIDNEDNKTIVCSFTIANDSIKASLLPNSRKKKVSKKIPHVKTSRSYPAVLIGRLGVNSCYKKKGIGKDLMDFIKSWFIDSQNKTGCRFIVVDAYNEEIPIKYYESCGFEFLFSLESQEKQYYNDISSFPLKTRLMYFDLIVLT